MNPVVRKYTLITALVIVAAATLFVAYSLVKDGTPTTRSQNEYLIEANRLHNDSLFEEAVEPYMKGLTFDKQRSLVNYNIATNSLKMNYEQLNKAFVEDGYQLDAGTDSALVEALGRLIIASDGLADTARYSSIFHNIGVANHMRDSLEIAAEAYKEALRKNPADEDARYNLAVILYQMKNNQQNQQQENQDKKEQEEQKQQQEQEKKEQEKKEQEQKEQQQQQNRQDKEEKEKEEEQENPQQQQQEQEQEEKEKIEQMLKALMQDEKEIREKMEEAEKVKVNGGYIEKNW